MNNTPDDSRDDPHDPKLSGLYRKASQAEPPPALDAAVLAAARAATAAPRPPRPWWHRLQAPFALAASVVLAVILTLNMDRNPPPDGEIPASKSNKAPAPAAEQAAPARPDAIDAQSAGAPAHKEAQRLPAAAEQRKPAAAALEAKREAAAPMPPAKPDAWIAEIRSLRRQGRPAEAERSLREFRAAYPDYPLPDDLR